MISWEDRQSIVNKPFYDELDERYSTPDTVERDAR
jgi:hypothetical protein